MVIKYTFFENELIQVGNHQALSYQIRQKKQKVLPVAHLNLFCCYTAT